ncbi:MAG TPA: hypothetical protein VJU59_20670, partial [Paraburkholderia sp.]|nr:hypothetical protein [Paraburkholderia sp.]
RRARVRLAREAAPQAAPVDKGQHARTVERLRDVLHAQDRVGLMDLLGVTASALVAASVAEAAHGQAPQEAPAARVLRAEALALDGEPGVALVAQDGALAAWLHVRDDRDGLPAPVVCVAAMEEGSVGPANRLEAANRAFGGEAVRKMLARLASSDGAACVSTLTVTARASTTHGYATLLTQPLVLA